LWLKPVPLLLEQAQLSAHPGFALPWLGPVTQLLLLLLD
jgi:hypothetical protein